MIKSIKGKTLTAFLALLLLLISVAIWASLNFNMLGGLIDNILHENYRSVVAAQNMMVAIERQDSAELSYIFGEEEALNMFTENEREFIKSLSRAEDNITIEGEEEIIRAIEKSYYDYLDSFDIMKQIRMNDGLEGAKLYYYQTAFKDFETVKEECRRLLEINQNEMVKSRDLAAQTAKNAIVYMTAISITIGLAGLVFALRMSNRILKPVFELIDNIRYIGKNDSVEITVSGGTDDELGLLIAEFNNMIKRLEAEQKQSIRNITEEKNKVEAIVESIQDGILVTDTEGRIILVNKNAASIFDISQTKGIGHHFLETIEDKDFYGAIKDVLDNKTRSIGFDKKISVKGKGRYFRIIATPIKSRSGELIGTVSVMQDITKLKEIDNMKSDFVSTVSHEFRTPLTSIIMGVDMLIQEVPGQVNDEQKELLGAVREDGTRLKNLVSDLLDLSRLESGKIDMNIGEHDIGKIIGYAMEPFRLQAKDAGVELDNPSVGDIPRVLADFNKISWVVTNLIGNALRYTPSGGKITVKADRKDGKVVVSVSDTGKGIPPEYHHSIFEKFVQVKENGNVEKGTGLGLAISREIIRAHKNDIWVESDPGKGSTFYFTLNIAG